MKAQFISLGRPPKLGSEGFSRGGQLSAACSFGVQESGWKGAGIPTLGYGVITSMQAGIAGQPSWDRTGLCSLDWGITWFSGSFFSVLGFAYQPVALCLAGMSGIWGLLGRVLSQSEMYPLYLLQLCVCSDAEDIKDDTCWESRVSGLPE